jgi:drug/metabolite transporter (DMT)-like permease
MAVSPNLRGIGAALIATGAFVANDTCMKLALSDAPPFQVLVMRGISACLWCLPAVLLLGYGRDLPKTFNPWVLLRSFSETGAILCFILALAQMPIADLTALVQITPFLVLMGSWLLWGEKIGSLRLVLIAVGIAGAIMVAQPGQAAASPFAIFGFLTAVGAAGRDLATRKVPTGTPALVVTFSTLLIVMLTALACMLAFEAPVPPTARHIGLMAVAGIFLMGGHLFIFLAFRLAPARTVAPFLYAFMLWAGISGLVVFDQVPNALALSGMALILLAGLGVIMLEGRTRTGDPAAVKS